MEQIKNTIAQSKKTLDNAVDDVKTTYTNYRNDGTILRKAFGTCRQFIENNYNATFQKVSTVPSPDSFFKPYENSFKNFCTQNSAIVNFSQTHPTLILGGISSLVMFPSYFGISYCMRSMTCSYYVLLV